MGPLIKCSYFYVFLFILYLSIIIFLSVYPVINKKIYIITLSYHRRKKVLNMVGRGGGGQGSEYWGAKGGKVFASCKLIGAPAPNQCQIITFPTLKTDNIANLRIELKSILLEIHPNKIKGTYIKLVRL